MFFLSSFIIIFLLLSPSKSDQNLENLKTIYMDEVISAWKDLRIEATEFMKSAFQNSFNQFSTLSTRLRPLKLNSINEKPERTPQIFLTENQMENAEYQSDVANEQRLPQIGRVEANGKDVHEAINDYNKLNDMFENHHERTEIANERISNFLKVYGLCERSLVCRWNTLLNSAIDSFALYNVTLNPNQDIFSSNNWNKIKGINTPTLSGSIVRDHFSPMIILTKLRSILEDYSLKMKIEDFVHHMRKSPEPTTKERKIRRRIHIDR
ncbi:hypothetical protein SNEBB_005533 [Seison nebaliae]|nr:hypothetical protein SNEBB_005533 [Seison nebaliae]